MRSGYNLLKKTGLLPKLVPNAILRMQTLCRNATSWDKAVGFLLRQAILVKSIDKSSPMYSWTGARSQVYHGWL
jgi:hypothetical protein